MKKQFNPFLIKLAKRLPWFLALLPFLGWAQSGKIQEHLNLGGHTWEYWRTGVTVTALKFIGESVRS